MSRKTLMICTVVCLSLAAGSCGLDPGSSDDRHKRKATLRPINDCQDLLLSLKKRAIQDMEIVLDENMTYALQYSGCSYYGDRSDGYYDDADYGYSAEQTNSIGAGEPSPGAADSSSGPSPSRAP